MNTDGALATIAEVTADSPDAVLLARLASPAIRIEPHLLRLLRTSLLPEADVSAEADLWFSPLVETAGADSIVLDAGIAEVLRNDLATERELLERTISLIRAAHAHLPPALQLEEEVTALALSGTDDAADRIDAALATALRALTMDAARAKETARWFARAWPRLPETVRRTRSAATLALAAGLLVRRRVRTAPVDANARIDDVRWVFREQSFTDFDNVDAFMEGDTVVFTEAGASGGMRVPRTDPRVVELSFGDQSAHEPLLVDASPGTAVSLPPDVTRLTLTTLAGDVYELERDAAFTADQGADEAPDSEEPWIDISPYRGVAAACVRVSAGETAYRIERTGVRVTSSHVVTVRDPLVSEDTLVVEPAAFGSKPRPRTDVEAPLLVIESDGPNPVAFGTGPFAARRVDPESEWFVAEQHDAVVLGFDGNELRAARGRAAIPEMMAAEFHVLVRSTDPLPEALIGGPVIVEDSVSGIVTSIEPSEREEGTWILVVASGLVIGEALHRATQQTRAAEEAAPAVERTETEQVVESEDAGSVPDTEQTASPETTPATGNRIAKIVVVAMDPRLAGEAVRSMSDRVVGSTEIPRKGVSWNVTVRGSPELRAGVVFWAARADREWPLLLDLRDAALVVVADDPAGGPSLKRASDDDTWADHIRAVVSDAAPHVPVISSSQLTGLTGIRFPSSDQTLRDALLGMIHWAAQPELDAETWKLAPRLAFQPPSSGPVGHTRELFSQVGGWDEEIDRWLGILTGGRVVADSDIVFRDPAWFENIVIAIVRAIDEEQKTRGIPGIDLFHAERLLVDQRLIDQARMPVATQSVVYAAATVLRDAGLAVLISTDYGSVVAMPGRAWDGSGAHRPGQGDRVMSASWTGDSRTGFFAVVAAFEWSDGRVEDIGWHSQFGEGVAWIERDGRYRIEARQSGPIADLVVTEEEASPSGYADRPLRAIRSALEEALADNSSLEIREERMLA